MLRAAGAAPGIRAALPAVIIRARYLYGNMRVMSISGSSNIYHCGARPVVLSFCNTTGCRRISAANLGK